MSTTIVFQKYHRAWMSGEQEREERERAASLASLASLASGGVRIDLPDLLDLLNAFLTPALSLLPLVGPSAFALLVPAAPPVSPLLPSLPPSY